MLQLLIIDNHDSFTFNLVQIVEQLHSLTFDVISVDQLDRLRNNDFQKVLISPGPGLPEEYPGLISFITKYASGKSILGICLGHQAIACVFGGSLSRLEKIVHGEPCVMDTGYSPDLLFNNIPQHFEAVRYHSWVVNKQTLPDSLKIICSDNRGNIMGIRHKSLPVWGLQFHPESFKTEYGLTMLGNWISYPIS